jgi:hypothetical protein
MTLCACALEDNFALLLEVSQGRVHIRKRDRPGIRRIGERSNPLIREQYTLEGR